MEGIRDWCRRERFATTLGCLFAVALCSPPAVAAGPQFDVRALNVLPAHEFDLGTTDFDLDGDADLFTTFHNGRSTVLSGDGQGNFVDVLSTFGLDQSRAFPGYEDFDRKPVISDPGLYWYARGDGIHVVASDLRARARVVVLGTAVVRGNRNAHWSVRQSGTERRPSITIRLVARPGGRLVIDPRLDSLPNRVRAAAPSPSQIYVGPNRVSPTDERFTLFLRDRHGMAWGDLEGDGDRDVYVVRGGLKGDIDLYRGLVQDELFIRDGPGFQDRLRGSGIRKGGCRGRVAATVDYNGDGRLDLFSSCLGGPPKLYGQVPSGEFRNRSLGLRRAGATDLAMRWIDVRGDVRSELVAVNTHDVSVYANRAGGWSRVQGLRVPRMRDIRGVKRTVPSIAPGDFDRDGDADVFLAGLRRNALLINRDGRFELRDPRHFGLPAHSTGMGTWLDYQNDGLLDFYNPAEGLFRQANDGKFVRTGDLAHGGRLTDALGVWPDIDGDGDRDGIVALKTRSGLTRQLIVDQGPTGHWLTVNATGASGSEAVGARVRVQTELGTQTAWVGASDSSRYSLGDYLVYFGLGSTDTVSQLDVTWPDGATATLRDVGADSVVTIPHPP